MKYLVDCFIFEHGFDVNTPPTNWLITADVETSVHAVIYAITEIGKKSLDSDQIATVMAYESNGDGCVAYRDGGRWYIKMIIAEA